MKANHRAGALAASMVSVLLVAGLTGCSGGSDTSRSSSDQSGTTVIKFGINVANPEKQEPATYAIVQAFNEANEGKYKVEFQAADTESHSKNLKLHASDGTLPEVFWVDGAQVQEFADSGVLLDLNDYLKQNPDIAKALDGAQDAFKGSDGVQFGLPYQSNVQGFFYNKELFDKAGISYPTDATSFDDFMNMVSALKASGVTPVSIGSKNSSFAMWEFNLWLTRSGWSENIDSILTGSSKFASSDIAGAFDKLQKLRDAGAFPDNISTLEYFDAKQQFDDGKAAMFGSGQWDCAEFDKSLGDKVGFWWGPKFTDSKYSQDVDMKVPSAPIAVSASVSDDAKAQEATFAFLNFYYSKDAAKRSYENSMFPATSYEGLAPASDKFAMNAMTAALANGYKSPAAAPDLTVPPAVQSELYDALFGVMQKTYTPAEALEKLDRAVENSK